MKHSSSEDDNGETVGDFDQYSTSIVWKAIYDVASSDLLPELNAAPSCEFTYNFGILPDEIDFNNGLLAVSNGELGILYSDLNSGRLPDYHRLDMSIKKTYNFSKFNIL